MAMKDDYSEEPTDGEGSDDSTESEYGGGFAEAIQEALPDQEWSEDRLAAMKEAIRLCVEKDTGGDMMGKGKMGKPGSLAIVFGGNKPKKE